MPPQPERDQSPDHVDDTLLQPIMVEEDEDPSLEPTLHDLQSQASVAGWNKLRGQMLLTAVEFSAMPEGQICLICSEKATLRCQQCGPLVHYCHQCYLKQHERANFFHVPEKWEVIPIAVNLEAGLSLSQQVWAAHLVLIGSPRLHNSPSGRELRGPNFP